MNRSEIFVVINKQNVWKNAQFTDKLLFEYKFNAIL